jgi:hypothetical protein
MNTDVDFSKKKFGTTRKKTKFHQKTKKSFLINPVLLYIKSLQKLYPSCIRDSKNNKELYKNFNITYGEMQYEGIELFYKTVMQSFFDEYDFIDIGSGRGKIPIYMASKQQIIKSIGIELVRERYNDSVSIFNKLKEKSKTFLPIMKKIFLFNKNVMDMNISQLSSIKNEIGEVSQKKSLIWISNLLFSKELSIQIFEKLSKELLPGSIICCSKYPFLEEKSNATENNEEIKKQEEEEEEEEEKEDNLEDLVNSSSDSDTSSDSEDDSEVDIEDKSKENDSHISIMDYFKYVSKIENFPMSWSENSSIHVIIKQM